jgi:hypothetical protein
MFSNHASWCPQLGHFDRGRKTESSRGHRSMQTFKNDPINAPSVKAKIA